MEVRHKLKSNTIVITVTDSDILNMSNNTLDAYFTFMKYAKNDTKINRKEITEE